MDLFTDDLLTYAKQMTGVPKVKCKEALNLVMDIIENAIRDGHTIRISSCLEIGTKQRKPWNTIDLKTGNRVDYEGGVQVYVKVGQRFIRAAKGMRQVEAESAEGGEQNG